MFFKTPAKAYFYLSKEAPLSAKIQAWAMFQLSPQEARELSERGICADDAINRFLTSIPESDKTIPAKLYRLRFAGQRIWRPQSSIT